LDGLAIGFSFQVSVAVGVVVAVAVLAHDFSDGINTVASILKSGNSKKVKYWLFADAIAPVLGIIVGSVFVVPEKILGYILSIFAGFFVYIALADMIPESFHSHPKRWTTFVTILGAMFIVLVIKLASF
jgi:ZIP family zinc transporter